MAKQVKQKYIRELINTGGAVDVTKWTDGELSTLLMGAGTVERLCYSHGVNGCNGAVIRVDDQLYATGCRSSNMFILL